MKYLRLGLAWEYVLADLLGAQRQALIELTGKDLLPTTGLLSAGGTSSPAWYGYDADDIRRSRVLVQERLSSISPLPNIVEPLSRLSRAVSRGDVEVYVFASGFDQMYKPVRLWLNAWGGRDLPLLCSREIGAHYAAQNLGLTHLIHTRASYPPIGGDTTDSLLIDTPSFDQSMYPEYLVANLDAALARVGFEG